MSKGHFDHHYRWQLTFINQMSYFPLATPLLIHVSMYQGTAERMFELGLGV